MERIETDHSDLNAQVCFNPPPSTEYESPAPSLKLNYFCQRIQKKAPVLLRGVRSQFCF